MKKKLKQNKIENKGMKSMAISAFFIFKTVLITAIYELKSELICEFQRHSTQSFVV